MVTKTAHLGCARYNRCHIVDVERQSADVVNVGPSSPELLSRSEKATPHITINSIRKKGQIIFVCYSLVSKIEHPVCQKDPLVREVSCVPGAWAED